MTTCPGCSAPVLTVQVGNASVLVNPNASHYWGVIAARDQGASLVGYRLTQGTHLTPGYLRYTPHTCTPGDAA